MFGTNVSTDLTERDELEEAQERAQRDELADEVNVTATTTVREGRIRVVFYRTSNAAGLHGWDCSVKSAATEVEALKMVRALMGRGVTEVRAQRLVGKRWETFASRKRGEVRI